jgi:hypothetical protein
MPLNPLPNSVTPLLQMDLSDEAIRDLAMDVKRG